MPTRLDCNREHDDFIRFSEQFVEAEKDVRRRLGNDVPHFLASAKSSFEEERIFAAATGMQHIPLITWFESKDGHTCTFLNYAKRNF